MIAPANAIHHPVQPPIVSTIVNHQNPILKNKTNPLIMAKINCFIYLVTTLYIIHTPQQARAIMKIFPNPTPRISNLLRYQNIYFPF